MNWELACLDMAGTTVRDEGLVEEAFAAAVASEGFAPDTPAYDRAIRFVRETMGQSKIDVFRALFEDETKAVAANLRFEQAYETMVYSGRLEPIDGAIEAIQTLRNVGVRVVLTTGFGQATQEAILDALGWRDLVDLAICPSDGVRGRPYPDMILAAILRLCITDVRTVAVAGDTPSDVRSGLRAGAGLVAGVLTGAAGRNAFLTMGATHVLGSISELPALLHASSPPTLP